MKKIYALALLCIPLCLILGFVTITAIGVSGCQRAQAQESRYYRETDSISMAEVGKLLERLGQEIQENNSVNLGGKSFSIAGQGRLELSVRPRREGTTTIQIEISAGATGTPTEGRTYVSFVGGSQRVTPAELTELVAKVGKTLANTGTIIMEDHKVALEGTASVVQRLMEGTPGRREGPYTFFFDVVFGEKDFPLPEDEEDAVEEEKRGEIKELAKKEVKGADQKVIVKLFDSLSNDLESGKVRLGDNDLALGDTIRYNGLTHLIATDGKSQRVRLSFQFGPRQPRPEHQQREPDEPRYGKETFERLPISEIGQLLKRIGTEILESGTITFEGVAYRAGQSGSYELGMRHDRFNIELGTNDSPPPPR